MTIDLEAIRARDAVGLDLTVMNCGSGTLPNKAELQAVQQVLEDRRALLAAYDALANSLHALSEAARKVTCRKCWGLGYVGDYEGRSPSIPCPDCADLRKLLEGER